MRINESCAECLLGKQRRLTSDEKYLGEIRELLDNRGEDDSGPYMVYLFNQVYERYFGARPSYREIKKKYNDLVLSMEDTFREKIEASDNPVETALLYARVGNYIDFGAMRDVDEETFLRLFEEAEWSEHDKVTVASFLRQCGSAQKFLLLADNCGEIVLDKLFIEQLKEAYPQLDVQVMVRGGEALNDATCEDACYVGIDRVARVISSGLPITGTVYGKLPEEARKAMDDADVILSKGQGNYECLNNQGKHIFYSFLCKCDLFTGRFKVPRLTGMFVEEQP